MIISINDSLNNNPLGIDLYIGGSYGTANINREFKNDIIKLFKDSSDCISYAGFEDILSDYVIYICILVKNNLAQLPFPLTANMVVDISRDVWKASSETVNTNKLDFDDYEKEIKLKVINLSLVKKAAIRIKNRLENINDEAKKLFSEDLTESLLKQGVRLSNGSKEITALKKIILNSVDEKLVLYPFAISPTKKNFVNLISITQRSGIKFICNEIAYFENLYRNNPTATYIDIKFSPMIVNSPEWLSEIKCWGFC
jgi:hypothetical protein